MDLGSRSSLDDSSRPSSPSVEEETMIEPDQGNGELLFQKRNDVQTAPVSSLANLRQDLRTDCLAHLGATP